MRDSQRHFLHALGSVRLESTLSSLITAAETGDTSATEALFSALYSELHRMAKRELARRGGVVSLSVTTLLHEAYLDMAGRAEAKFPDRARFMGYAARVMRGLIIDHARNRRLRNAAGFSKLLPSTPPTSLKLPMKANCHGSATRSTSSRKWMPSLPSSSISSSFADSPSPKLPPCATCRSAQCSESGKRQESIFIASYAPI